MEKTFLWAAFILLELVQSNIQLTSRILCRAFERHLSDFMTTNVNDNCTTNYLLV